MVSGSKVCNSNIIFSKISIIILVAITTLILFVEKKSSSLLIKSSKSSSDTALARSYEEDEDPNPFCRFQYAAKFIAFNNDLLFLLGIYRYTLFLAGKTRDFNNVLRKNSSLIWAPQLKNGYTQLKNAITFKRRRV